MEKQEGVAVEYAGFWMRLGAYLIDGLILNAVGWIIWIFFGLIIAAVAAGDEPAGGAVVAIWLIAWLITVAVSIAYLVCFWQWRGQTPGKMALGIKIIKTDGSALDWGTALLRFLGYIICWITLGLLFLWVAFDGRKQGVQDKIPETYVIILPRRRAILPETYEAG